MGEDETQVLVIKITADNSEAVEKLTEINELLEKIKSNCKELKGLFGEIGLMR